MIIKTVHTRYDQNDQTCREDLYQSIILYIHATHIFWGRFIYINYIVIQCAFSVLVAWFNYLVCNNVYIWADECHIEGKNASGRVSVFLLLT